MEVCDELKALRDTEERELGVQNMNHRRRKKKKKGSVDSLFLVLVVM